MKRLFECWKGALLIGLSLGLMACDGKEDFSGLGADDCPIGANCRVEAAGDLLVELSGPVVGGLGYVCGSSLEYIRLEDTETSRGLEVPAGMAACPGNAEEITFYLGRATDGGHHVELGKAYLPAMSRVTLNTGSERELVRLTWADVIDSPRRADVASVENHLALLSRLDAGDVQGDYIHEPVSFAQCFNDALDNAVANEQADLSALSSALETGDLSSWEALIQKIEQGAIVSNAGANVCEDFVNTDSGQSPEDLKASLHFAMNATRAGNIALSYQDQRLLALLVSDEVPLAPNPNRLGQLGGELLVFPNGAVKGFATATLFSGVNIRENESGFIYRDLLAVKAGSDLSPISDKLELDLSLKGKEISPPKFLADITDGNWIYEDPEPTDITLTGKFLSSSVLDGVVWEPREVNKSDVDMMFPGLNSSKHPKGEELGRFTGEFLGASVSQLLQDHSQEAAPVRVIRTSYGSTQLHQAVFDQLAGQTFTFTLMRGCADDDEDGCVSILENDHANYPISQRFETDLSVGQGGAQVGDAIIEIDVYQFHKPLLELELKVQEAEGHLYVYETSNTSRPVGYVSHTQLYSDEGARFPESAIFTIIFDDETLLEDEDREHLYGIETQGRLDLRSCEGNENRFYRLSDANFKSQQSAGWVGNYWALKALEEARNNSDQALKEALVYAQGSAYMHFQSCP